MVPIKGDWHRFANPEEQLRYMRLWGLIPPKSKQLRPIMVVDGYFGAPEPCSVVGYKDDNWAVIELPDGYHAIFGEYLAELQPNAMQKLPHGMCFAEILQDYIVLDIETTGFSRKEHEIIEFAAVRYSYGKETAHYHTLVQPKNPIPLNITSLTGITMADVADAPFIEDVAGDILQFIGDRPIVGHNGVTFDFPFISAHLNFNFDNPKIDTLYMARKAFPLLSKHKLEYLKTVLNLTDGASHRALDDARTTNALLWACLAPRKHEQAVNEAYLANLHKGGRNAARTRNTIKPLKNEVPVQALHQESLFDKPIHDTDKPFDESGVFLMLEPYLIQVLEYNRVGADSLRIKCLDNYTSVYYYKPEQTDEKGDPIVERARLLAFRICARNGKYYFGVKKQYLKHAPESAQRRATPESGDTGYMNVPFAPNESSVIELRAMLEKALDGAIDMGFTEYSCCSRCEECSLAKRCVSPFPYIASNCKYRKIMKEGRIFYGPNRNID